MPYISPLEVLQSKELVNDLWWFIENVTDEDPERTDKFFALRERVRNFYEKKVGTP